MCRTGWSIERRESVDSDDGWTMVSPDQQFLCNGQVTEWQYQGKKSNAFRAIVWRPVQGSATQFQIVGINDIPAGVVDTLVTYIVPENERITVKAGDVIGWSFSGSVLTQNTGGSFHVRYTAQSTHETLRVGESVTINGGVEYREYSIAAIVCNVCDPGKELLF